MPGELADRRRLAGPIDADDHDHRGTAPQIDPSEVAARDLGEQLDESVANGVGTRDATGIDLRLEPPDDVGGGLCPDVGEDQRLLEPLPCLVVELLEEARAELRLQGLAALRQTRSQTAKHASLLLLHRFEIAGWRRVRGRTVPQVENLTPGNGHGAPGYPGESGSLGGLVLGLAAAGLVLV